MSTLKVKMVVIYKDNIEICIKAGMYGCTEGNNGRNLKRLFDLAVCDKLIFYATGASQFAGIFEVTKPFFESNEKIWEDAIYPYRVSIKPVIYLPEDHWINAKGMVNDLEFFSNKVQWSMHLLNNLMPVNENDYKLLHTTCKDVERKLKVKC